VLNREQIADRRAAKTLLAAVIHTPEGDDAMAAWVFGGQGTQHRGMGAGLFEEFGELCREADGILGYPVRTLCLEDPGGRLADTRYAQPALFVVNALSFLSRDGGQPAIDYLAGHSLGEFNALHAAGCFDFATGLRLVQRRGELMAQAAGGGMVAVLAPDARELAERVRAEVPDVDIANDNGTGQVVLAGPRTALAAVAAAVRRHGAGRCVPLSTSAAFHSRYMTDAARSFERYLGRLSFADPGRPVISNVTGLPYPPGQVAALLARQVNSPVRWRDTMRYLLGQGVRDLVEISPRRVLTPLWQQAAADHEPAMNHEPAADHEPAMNHEPAADHEPAAPPAGRLRAEDLGSAEFRLDYGVRYAYLAGSMFRGVASAALVVRMANAGLMGFFGAGGLDLKAVADALRVIQRDAGPTAPFGVNLLYSLDEPAAEDAAVEMYLRHGVRFVEAAAYPQVTPALVRFRFTGAHRDHAGRPVAARHVVAKVSRLSVASAFMEPPPEPVLAHLVGRGELTAAEAEAARHLPVSGDVCVEADSAGHTDGGVALVLVPAVAALREEMMTRHRYQKRIRVGASGGLGSPAALAAVFTLGADFVVTGSVNQCSPEAGTSAAVKDVLAGLDVHDTAYAPAGDLFELGAKVQVVRRGSLFAARANKLYQLYRQFSSVEEIDAETRRTLEQTCFRCSLDEVWQQTVAYYRDTGRAAEIEQARRNPKRRMALLFRWYFAQTTRHAMEGDTTDRVNFQIHCGPAQGAFNRFVRGSDLADWRDRHVELIAERLMCGAAEVLNRVPRRC
jgi:trans-AT polyketide synthase/acyltransferase/oxidoreductase domain-containing protein